MYVAAAPDEASFVSSLFSEDFWILRLILTIHVFTLMLTLHCSLYT